MLPTKISFFHEKYLQSVFTCIQLIWTKSWVKISFSQRMLRSDTMKLYILRGELISFENEYLNFKNESLILFETLNSNVDTNTANILKLQNDLDEAKGKINILSGMLAATTSAFAVLLVLSFVFIPRRINNRIHG